MTQTTKHTPGPWHVHGAPSTYQHEQPRDIVSGHSLIATACMLNNMRGETLANARLIAAAPDMVSEIRKQIDWLKHARAELQGIARESLLLGFDQSIKYLSAVLAKAEGR
ncbi:MAG: hypothetical protein ACRCTG_14590 [Aestuariivirga sp.]